MRKKDLCVFGLLATLLLFGLAVAIAGEDKPWPKNPTTVDQLPPCYRFTNEEIAEILPQFREASIHPASVVKTESVTCEKCALILRGHLLQSPFKLERTRDAIFVNGFKLFPKPIFPMPTSAACQKARNERKAQEEWEKANDPCRDYDLTEIHRVRSEIEKCNQNEDPETRKTCIRSVLDPFDVRITTFVVTGRNQTIVSFESETDPCFAAGITHFASAGESPMERNVLDQWKKMTPEEQKQELLKRAWRYFREQLGDHRVFDATGDPVQWEWFNPHHPHCFDSMKTILQSSKSPTVKLYLLFATFHIPSHDGFFLLANENCFLKEIERFEQ